MVQCNHVHARTYGKYLKISPMYPLCQVWWCSKCGALAIRKYGRGRPAKAEWRLPQGGIVLGPMCSLVPVTPSQFLQCFSRTQKRSRAGGE